VNDFTIVEESEVKTSVDSVQCCQYNKTKLKTDDWKMNLRETFVQIIQSKSAEGARDILETLRQRNQVRTIL
jgi:hypothetical protein